MAELTIKEWLEKIPDHFSAEMADRVDARLQMSLSGEGGGDWYVTIKDNQITWAEGSVPDARATLTGKAEDVVKILNGRLDPVRAYMLGKVKLHGDIAFAMSLVKLFKA